VLADVGRSFSVLDSEAQAAAMSGIKTGSAIAGVGIGLSAIGLTGLSFFKSATQAAVDYNQQAALTLTQVDQTGVSLENIKQIGRDVAAAIPAPFQQMQSSLYDIFSSMDVNTTQAQTLLTAFSKGAVAGQVDVQQAGRATIAIMNAFKVPVSDVNKVMDVQFETVKKGVITYDEFSSTVGRAIPSAQRAGQSYAQLGAMIAFMTRNGLSAAQASTSAARALDMLSNPKFAQNMKEFGINVYDAQGNIRPMTAVIDDLRAKLQGLTPEQVTAKLKELGTGAGGTIQAMRFLNLAVNDTQGMFDSLTSDIANSSGSMQNAYDIMFKQPQSQSQLFKNNLDILKTEIGDAFLPALNRVLQVGTDILKWFDNMDPGTRKTIMLIAAAGFTFLTVAGFILIFVGSLIILNGVLALTTGSGLGTWMGEIFSKGLELLVVAAVIWGLVHAFQALQDNDVIGTVVGLATAFVGLAYAFATFDALAGITAAVAAALSIPFILAAALIAAVVIAVLALGYIIYRNWNTIRDVTIEVWGIVWGWMQTVWDKMQQFWDWITSTSANVWGHMKDIVTGAWDGIITAFGKARDFVVQAWSDIVQWAQNVWNKIAAFASWFWGTFGPGIMNVVHAIAGFFSDVGAAIYETIIKIWSDLMWFWSGFMTIFVPVFWFFWDQVSSVWNLVYDLISNNVQTIVDIFQAVLGPAIDMISIVFQQMLSDATLVWGIVVQVISFAVDVIHTIIEFTVGVIEALWANFGSTIWSMVVGVWNLITGIIATAITLVKDIILFVLNIIQGDWGAAWNSIKQFFVDAWNGIWNALQAVWGLMKDFFVNLPWAVLGFIGDLAHLLWDAGWHLLHGLYEGVLSVWFDFAKWCSDIPHNILSFIGDLGHILWDAGVAVIKGFIGGIGSMFGAVGDKLGELKDKLTSWKGPPEDDAKVLIENGQLVMQGFLKGLTSGYDDVQKFLGSVAPDLQGAMTGNIGVSGPNNGAPLNSYNVHQWSEGAIQVNGVTDPVEVAQQVHAQFNEVVNERIMSGVR
jgi:TP901 family phage tail tape measure protein